MSAKSQSSAIEKGNPKFKELDTLTKQAALNSVKSQTVVRKHNGFHRCNLLNTKLLTRPERKLNRKVRESTKHNF